MERVVSSIGKCTIKILDLGDVKKRVLWSGDDIIIVQPGRLDLKGIMEGLLLNLRACARELKFLSTYIVSKNTSATKQDQFQVGIRLASISPNKSENLLRDLSTKTSNSEGLRRCSPDVGP